MDYKGYEPGPAMTAQVEKDGDMWTLVLSRELRHSPDKVWKAITDPVQLREWAPYESDVSLEKVGSAKLAWVGAPAPTETNVIRADVNKVLEYDGMRWELEATGTGTRLTMWHAIQKNFISMGAAGWHLCFDVLDRLLAGDPIGRIVGGDAMAFQPWHRLQGEYAAQFGVEVPKW